MPSPIRMPGLGQTSDELRVVAWIKAEGDLVREGDVILEVESDKAVHEVEASATGTLLCIVHPQDTTVVVGTTLGWIGEPGESFPVPTPETPGDSVGVPTPETPGDSVRVPAPETPGDSVRVPTPQPPAEPRQRVPATPVARRVARELGVELSAVRGTGPDGRIEREDVLRHSREHVPAGGPPGDSSPSVGELVPAHRRAIARRLSRSTAVPQFSVGRTVDARQILLRSRAVEGATVTHVLLQATGRVLERFPIVNRVWVDDGPSFRTLERAIVGLAIASEDRLVVATIEEPHRRSLAELAREVRDVVADGRNGRLSAASATVPAITVSNLGMFGADRFDAIVDPDQTAILAVGRIVARPAVIDGQVQPIPQAELSLAVDHRTVDGADAARFLSAICDDLEAAPE